MQEVAKDGRRARDRVLDAAKELFDGRPLAEISLLEIQHRADVSSSTLHYVFPTKEALVRAAHQQLLAEQANALSPDQWPETYDGLAVSAVITDIIHRYIGYFTERSARMATLHDAERTYPDLGTERERVDDLGVAIVTDYLSTRGVIGDEDAEKRCEFAMRTVTSTAQRFLGPPAPFAELMGVDSTWVADRLAETAIALLVRPSQPEH